MSFRKRKLLIFVILSICISASIVYVLFDKYYFIYSITGRSMEPVLNNNDRILIRKTDNNYNVDRFDIIVLKKKTDTTKLIVKRVIGLPGEIIEIKRNIVFINKNKLLQPFLKEVNEREIVKDPKDLPLIKIPDNSFFLIGDNRELSKDSRDFGVINRKEIIGKAIFSYMPFKMLN